MTDLLTELLGNKPSLIDQSMVREIIDNPIVEETHQLKALELLRDATGPGIKLSIGPNGDWISTTHDDLILGHGGSLQTLRTFLTRRAFLLTKQRG